MLLLFTKFYLFEVPLPTVTQLNPKEEQGYIRQILRQPVITNCWLFTFSHLFDQTLTQVALWRDFSYVVKVSISWVDNRGWSWVIQTESSELLTRLGYYWTKSERDSVWGRAWNGGAHIARHAGGQRCWEKHSPDQRKGSGDLSATTTRSKILQRVLRKLGGGP